MKLSLFTRGEHLYDVPIDGTPVQIGRDGLNDLVLPDAQVARFHACLRKRGPAVEVLARSAPVVVIRAEGDEEVERLLVHPPAMLRFGRFEVAVLPRDEAAARAAEGHVADAAQLGPERDTLPARGRTERPRLALRLEPDGPARVLEGGTLRIGKAPDNDLVVDDPYVSSYHCRVVERDGRHQLLDLGSRNGTIVNGARVDVVELEPGLRLAIGGRELRVVERHAAAPRRRVRRYHGMVSADPVMHALFDRIEKVASHDAPVLILGESGTGKELVARALHEAAPERRGRFVALNCGAISAQLVESELFGHERGAFTGASARRRGLFEEAQGGTLFLDEIGELPLALQPKLLRVLETRRVRRVGGEEELPVQVRLVAATHRPLADEVDKKQFRLDLYMRLAVIALRLPPLRARAGDVPLLLGEFLRQERRDGLGLRLLAPGVLDELVRHSWPGNVRELRNAVARAVVQGDTSLSLADFLGTAPEERAGQPALIRAGGRPLAEIEREAIQLELSRQGGNRRRTAAVLGMARSTLGDKLRRFGLSC